MNKAVAFKMKSNFATTHLYAYNIDENATYLSVRVLNNFRKL